MYLQGHAATGRGLISCPESAVNSEPPQKTKKKKKPPHLSHTPAPLQERPPKQQHVVDRPSVQRAKRRSSSSDSADSKPKRLKQDPLVVSINRTSIEAQQKLHPGSTMRVKKKRPLDTQDSFWKEQEKDSAKKKLTVQVPRSKLKGEFSSTLREGNREMMMMHYEDMGDSSFMLGGGMADQVVPSDDPYAG